MTTLTVDRIEGAFAVCERGDGGMVDVALSALPEGIHEGAVLRVEDGAVTLDARAEEDRRAQIKKRMDKLWK